MIFFRKFRDKNIFFTRINTTSEYNTLFITKRIFVLLTCLSFITLSAKGKDEESSSLKITSYTENNSADINIQEEKDKENGTNTVTDEMKNKDYERSTVGTGEVILLTLEGKNIGNPQKVTWTITEGKEYASFLSTRARSSNSGSATTTLVIGPTATSNCSVIVEAKNEFEEKATKSFSICVPSRIVGQHILNPQTKKRGVPMPNYPQDGNTQVAGASAILDITVQPTNVSFKGIGIKESDLGTSDGSSHTPNPNSVSLDKLNRIKDNIGQKQAVANAISDLEEAGKPISFWWKCGFKTNLEHNLGIYMQEMKYELLIDKNGKYVKVSVSKFSCAVNRTTNPGNVHHFE